MNFTEIEIAPGLVMHLCPKTMLAKGGKVTCRPEFIVQGHHFFLVTHVGPKHCRLVPLYTDPGVGRIALSDQGRTGHSLWLNGKFHFHVEQVWDVSKAVAVLAAKAAHDQSRPGARNLLLVTHIPKLKQEHSICMPGDSL